MARRTSTARSLLTGHYSFWPVQSVSAAMGRAMEEPSVRAPEAARNCRSHNDAPHSTAQ